MNLARPLAVVTPTLDGDVLRVLALADTSFTVGQIQRLVGRGARSGLRKVLERLVAQGIVQADRKPAVVLYTFNRKHLAAAAIVSLAHLRDSFIERLSEKLGSWRLPPVHAALFGSAARGDMRPDSDIDLFIVRPRRVKPDNEQWRDQLDDLAAEATSWTGNDARVLEYGEQELLGLRPQTDPVVDAVLEEGIVLIGDLGQHHRLLRSRGG